MQQTVRHAVLRVSRARKAHDLVGASVQVSGWVRSVRKQGKVSFVGLSDGSSVGHLQVVVPSDELPPVSVGSSVSVCGVLAQGPVSHGGDMEIQTSHHADFSVLSRCESKTYPLQKKFHSPEFLRDILHLRPRSNLAGAVLRLRNGLSHGIRQFFTAEDFIEINTPILTSNDCEGAGEMFRVAPEEFFGSNPAYLTVSGQLHAEMFACAMSRVYTFGPTFRAENSNTSRHLAEFWMVEPEIAFADENDAMDIAERCVKHTVRYALDNCTEDIDFFAARVDKSLARRLQDTVEAPFERLTYDDAINILKSVAMKEAFEHPVEWGMDLKSEHERFLAEKYYQNPVFVTNYPASLKPFYMKRNADEKTVSAYDLLVPTIGELVGGSAREDRFDVLEEAMRDHGFVDQATGENPLDWYLDLRKYGSVPHAGWGMGFERLVQYVSGVPNIRDVVPAPRFPGACRL
jgi:asparaginyl-tRNA synthetase